MTAKRNQPALGQAAWRACRAHAGEMAVWAALHVLLRALVLLPLLLPDSLMSASLQAMWTVLRVLLGAMVLLPASPPAPEAGRIIWIALAVVFLLIPLRFAEGERLRFCSGPNQPQPRGGRAYFRWLKMGLARWGHGCVWGLPFLACAGYLAYGWAHLPFTAMWMPVQEAARLIGREPGLAAGLPVAGALLALFTALFAYGWWRLLPAEYLPIRHLDVRKAWLFLRRARTRGRKQLRRNALVNMLLSLPAILGFAAVLGQYVRSRISLSVSPELIVASLMRLLKTPLPGKTAAEMAAVFLVLYLPLMILRKMRSAVLVRRLTRECGDLGGGHAAG